MEVEKAFYTQNDFELVLDGEIVPEFKTARHQLTGSTLPGPTQLMDEYISGVPGERLAAAMSGYVVGLLAFRVGDTISHRVYNEAWWSVNEDGFPQLAMNGRVGAVVDASEVDSQFDTVLGFSEDGYTIEVGNEQ